MEKLRKWTPAEWTEVSQWAEPAGLGVWFPILESQSFRSVSKHAWSVCCSLRSACHPWSRKYRTSMSLFRSALWFPLLFCVRDPNVIFFVFVCLCAGREAHEEINITFTLPVSWSSDECVLHGHCEQVVFSTCMTITATSNIFPVTVWVGTLPPTPERAQFPSRSSFGSVLHMKLCCVKGTNDSC